MPSLRPSRAAGWILLAFATAPASLARAEGQPAPAPARSTSEAMARAAALFAEAGRLVEAGQPAAACPKYEESLRLYDGLNTRYFLADCYVRVGRMASAWRLFGEVADRAAAAGDTEKAEWARERAAAVKPKLWSTYVQVQPSSASAEVDVPVLDDDAPPLERAPTSEAPGASDARGRRHLLALVVGGVGVVGIGVSAALAFAANGFTLYVNFPDRDTDPAGRVCKPGGVLCNDSYGKGMTVGTSWSQIKVPFSILSTDGAGAPGGFDAGHVYAIEFHASPAEMPFDFSVDDIALYK